MLDSARDCGCRMSARSSGSVSRHRCMAIDVDNATAVAYANGTVKRSKIRHIHARQDWVSAISDISTCNLRKVDTKENKSGLP